MVYLILGVGMFILSVVFRLAAVFRLTIPLAYVLFVPTLFHGWYETHRALGEGIFYTLLAVVVLSWMVSLARKIRHLIDVRREDELSTALLRQRLRQNREHGVLTPGGGYAIRVDDLWQDVD